MLALLEQPVMEPRSPESNNTAHCCLQGHFVPMGLMTKPWDFTVRREGEEQKLAQQLSPQQPREEGYK